MILAVGAVPKKLSYPHLKEIPIEVAVDPEKLAQQPLDDATVAVFGSSHSTMIVLPHLLHQPVKRVINFYRSPLKYAVYQDDWILFDDTGLKGHAADWARENIDGVLPQRLERCWTDSPEFDDRVAECDHAIYTVGFERRTLPEVKPWGQLDYNAANGIIAPGLFGLGIAFPGLRDRPVRLRPISGGAQEIHGPHQCRPAVVVGLSALTGATRLISAAATPGHRGGDTPNRTAHRCAAKP